MAILRGDELCLSFGTHILLDRVKFSIERGEKIGIVGRNGAGKSSLMKLIAGVNLPDQGNLQKQKDVRVRYLPQALPEALDMSVFDYVAGGVSDLREGLERYQQLLETQIDSDEVNQLHDFLDRTGAWHWEQKVESVLSRLELDGSASLADLSGGWRRRVSLAECLAAEPDLLLLDEPTNHLDLETIEWLEQSIQQFKGAVLLISHDRAFIDAIVATIWEIDRGILRVFPAPYDKYLEQKQLQLAEEEKVNAEFDKRLANEEKWIRQGIKARRTRNEGRVRALKKMRDERRQRREQQTTAKLDVKSGGGSGKLVAVLENVYLSRGGKQLISDFTTTIVKGDKIGVLGPNGCGKSSLIKAILGELTPDSGMIELGTQLEIAYFDQMRSSIRTELTIMENIGEGRDFIEVNGEKRHVISYLSDYGFGPERMNTPASSLSGGEISRLVLAKLFTRAGNLLILDEPTNDLDIDTLELLESQLVAFSGTVIVISHDRRFLDNVASALMVFDGPDGIVEIAGGFQEYQHYRQKKDDARAKQNAAGKNNSSTRTNDKAESIKKENAAPAGTNAPAGTKKLSYKLQRELDNLPAELEQLEAKIEEQEKRLSQPEFAQSSNEYENLASLQQALEQKLDRWEALEAMKSAN
ncbi:MAG: ATP-binding cassette domain-containing protein [Gammaproteobacteria bacterium]|nr:ATP-binding cassette domain-containing protein [Gammaproteobacteria bacterium]